ncbi:hypothetical protein [Dysgonomonas sp. 520]|uniref:hypothetical protein n=1 Tax=Dysgonomonas sp. 520 TaxID=2302931 RepID=UPI0013D6F2AB|nr:hypothetical protein [Dysgonomonas sp. 520]NDW10980.1 hypothetical protein [Dysgonomonas sp. 520]
MKEYIAETGGRYTYSDDILNLQELSLSMTSIFSECSNFIISGLEVSGNEISQGYVWINGKIRLFQGVKDITFPYYIYEKNNTDTTTYANEVNKKGRTNYLCVGGTSVPDIPDAVTGKVPQFIELKQDYSPRFIDKFFGRYAVLLETPFAKQTIKKDLVVAGKFSGEKDIESKTSVSVVNTQNGYTLRNIVKASGDGSVGAYLNGLLINEIVISTDGSFCFMKQGKVIATVTESGISYSGSSATTSQTGAIHIYGSNIINTDDATDDGSVDINKVGYNKEGTKFRNLNVFDGKGSATPLFQVNGKTSSVYVNCPFYVNTSGKGISLSNTSFLKSDKRLTGTFSWTDSDKEEIAAIGYVANDSFDFLIKNNIGNIVVSTKGYLDILGELRINGIAIGSTYVTQVSLTAELKKKVNIVAGKQLSTEDFTTEYKKKLDSISQGSINNEGEGFVSAKEVAEALGKKLTILENLSDLKDKGKARTNLDVFSKAEVNSGFLKVSGNLLELVTLTADEVNGLTTEQITQKKEQKQSTVRNNIDAEKKGTGDLKLAKASNLSDLPDKAQARKNISVYSTTEIDNLLKGKLSTDAAYTGAVFTNDQKKKLEDIKTGNFQGVDNEGKTINQTEGYSLVSHIVKEFAKKANLLLDGYNDSQKSTIAANIGVYSKSSADAKFASVESLFQDYITHLVKQGKNTSEAQKILRDKLNAPSKEDVSENYLRRDSKLTDLSLPNADAKKLVCRTIGAAYADEYQTKLIDTGWIQMNNSGSGTDTRNLFIRQIGNVVCIQGIINTAKRDGSNKGGTIAIIPNQISPPKYGLRTSFADYNDDHKYNRGASFVIQGNTRKILIYESGWYNVNTEIHFTYMT